MNPTVYLTSRSTILHGAPASSAHAGMCLSVTDRPWFGAVIQALLWSLRMYATRIGTFLGASRLGFVKKLLASPGRSSMASYSVRHAFCRTATVYTGISECGRAKVRHFGSPLPSDLFIIPQSCLAASRPASWTQKVCAACQGTMLSRAPRVSPTLQPHSSKQGARGDRGTTGSSRQHRSGGSTV